MRQMMPEADCDDGDKDVQDKPGKVEMHKPIENATQQL